MPSAELPEVAFRVSDKLMHVVIFFILAVLFLLAAKREKFLAMKAFGLYKVIISVLLTVALLTEGLQNFIPGRNGDFYDLLANASGILIGVLVTKLFYPS